jgi:hypothetical protein
MCGGIESIVNLRLAGAGKRGTVSAGGPLIKAKAVGIGAETSGGGAIAGFEVTRR